MSGSAAASSLTSAPKYMETALGRHQQEFLAFTREQYGRWFDPQRAIVEAVATPAPVDPEVLQHLADIQQRIEDLRVRLDRDVTDLTPPPPLQAMCVA